MASGGGVLVAFGEVSRCLLQKKIRKRGKEENKISLYESIEGWGTTFCLSKLCLLITAMSIV